MSQKGVIKTTKKAILDAAFTLFNLAGIDSWPVRIKCELSDLVAEFRPLYSSASEIKDSLVRKYAAVNPDTGKTVIDANGKINVDPEKYEQFDAENKELLRMEVTMQSFKVIIPAKDIPDNINSMQMALVRDFITFKKPDAE